MSDEAGELPVADFDEPSPFVERPVSLQRKITYLPDCHRLLPQSPDAELGVLSSILLAPREVLELCEEKNVATDWFHIPSHGTIYRVMREMKEEHKAIDVITLTADLRDRNLLDIVGGAGFVTPLFSFLPTAANANYYIEILKEKYILRKGIQVCTEFAARGYDEQGQVNEWIAQMEQAVLAIHVDRGQGLISRAKEVVMEAMLAIQQHYDCKGSITGLATGYPDLDRLIDGLHDGEMTVIAARPSMGKTALAMNIAEFIAVELKQPVAIFSIEMTKSQLMQRMICSRSRVNLSRVRDGFLSDRDFPAMTQAGAALAESPMFFDDSSDITIQELRARARRLKQQHGIRAVFIDYLQLIRSDSAKSRDNRQQEVAEVSLGLKAMAKELSLPVVVLAQMSRDFDKRSGNSRSTRPRLSDLRESGAIEQDADLVAFLVREEMYAESDEERRECEGLADLTIAKQRNGPSGVDVPLTFLKEFTRFETRARSADDEEYQQEVAEQQAPKLLL